MDNRVYQYTANTAVYNPMGVIHRHQSFTPGLSSGLLYAARRSEAACASPYLGGGAT